MVDYYLQKGFESEFAGWPNQERLARFWSEEEDRTISLHSESDFQQLIDNPVAGIERISFERRIWYEHAILSKDQQPRIGHQGWYVNTINPDFIAVHGLKNIAGETLNVSYEGVLVSERYVKNFIGDENPIGWQVQLGVRENESASMVYKTYIITDVIQDPLLKNFRLMDMYLPVQNPVYKNEESKTPVILIAKDASSDEINQRLRKQFSAMGEDGRRIIVMTQSDMKNNVQTLMIQGVFLLLGSLILISAMINFLKFSIQTFLIRTRELSLRKGLGARNIQLFAMLFTEIVIVLLLSMLMTYLVTKVFLRFYYDYLPSPLLHDLQTDEWKLFLVQINYLFYLLGISGVICGLAIIRVKNLGIISGINGAGKGKHGVRNFFLGFQLVICFFFTGISVAAFFMYIEKGKQQNMTLSKEEREHIWHLELYGSSLFLEQEQEIYSRIQALSDVEDIVITLRTGESVLLPDGREVVIKIWKVGENYPAFMNFQFSGRMPHNSNEAIISRALMQALEKDNPENSYTIKIAETFLPIIGTYELLPFESTGPDMSPTQNYSIITGLPDDFFYSDFWIKSRKGKKNEVKESIQNIISEYISDPTSIKPVSMREEHLMFDGVEVVRDLFLILSGVSLLIMALGIYSAITLDTRSRQKEVAIRKINGANHWDIIRLFAKLYVRLLIVSAIIGLLIVTFIFRSEILPVAISPLLYILIIVIVSGVVTLSVLGRIWQISLTNPAEALKVEN